MDKAKEAAADIEEEVTAAKSEIKGNVAALRKSGSEKLEEYKVVVQDLVDSSVEFIQVDAEGNFSLNLDSLKSIALTVLDDGSSVAGIVRAGSSIGFSPTQAQLELGELEFGGENIVDLAASALEKLEENEDYRVIQSQAATLGYGLGGSGGGTFDRDADGVIDLFDVDLDNNGILNDQDVEDLQLKLNRLGEAVRFAENIDLTTSLVTEYKMPVRDRMKQAGLNLKVFPRSGVAVDSITITGPDFLTGATSEWRYMCNTCPGDNRPLITEGGQPVKGKMKLAEDGGMPQWQAFVGDQSDIKSISRMKPGDVIVYTIHAGALHIPVLRTVTWVFHRTPTLEKISLADGTVLYDRAAIEAFATRPAQSNPAIDSTADAVFTVNMMRGITPDDSLPLLGFDHYEIQFMQEGMAAGQSPRQVHVANITNVENGQYIRYLEATHQLEVTIPTEYLRQQDPAMDMTGYKIDLGMYDRSRNKTVMQIRLNTMP